MPAKIRKLPNKNKWRVSDTKGHIHSFGTTKVKAIKQRNLLNRLHKSK